MLQLSIPLIIFLFTFSFNLLFYVSFLYLLPIFSLRFLPLYSQENEAYKAKFDDIPDIQARDETSARFRKAEQWGLRAWNDEYFALMDFPDHVLRVLLH
jgi:hypothetical protein